MLYKIGKKKLVCSELLTSKICLGSGYCGMWANSGH